MDSLLASYLMVDKYALNWMQYCPHLPTSCKASRQKQFLQMMIPPTPRWVPAVVVKRTGTLTIFKFGLFPGGIWRRHIDQLRPRYPSPKMINQERTTPLALTIPQILNKSVMYQTLPLKMPFTLTIPRILNTSLMHLNLPLR